MSACVKKWLSEYKTSPEGEHSSYASSLCHNEDLIQELYDLFEDDFSHEVIDPVCHQLFDFYRSADVVLQRFTLQLVPSLVWAYLYALSYSDKKKCGGIEACLLGIYNLEVVDTNGKAKQKNVTIPSLAVSSLFHEPPSLASLVLTESALTRYYSDAAHTITIGPLPQVESLNAYNRLPILTFIMNRYSADIVNLSSRSHSMLCKLCSRLTKTGFEDLGETGPSLLDFSDSLSSEIPRRNICFAEELRIPLSSGLLVELLSAVYYVMFNGQAQDGRQALEDIHWRASYELYPDVLLVTNAIRNSLQVSSSGQLKDVPMGISIALSPSLGNPAFSKDAITNASFRARKLPEDIDVQDNMDGVSLQQDTANDDNTDGDLSVTAQRLVSGPAVESKPSPLQHKSVSTAKGPLKSIMKKREERARDKIQRKEMTDMASLNAVNAGATQKRGSHFKEFLELHVSKSPRHSVSMSGMAAASSNDASSHIVDSSSIQLNIIRSGSGANRQSLDVDLGSVAYNNVSQSSITALNETNANTDDTVFDRNSADLLTDSQDVISNIGDRDEDEQEHSDDFERDVVINKTQF
jgi:hypothetical protein